MYDQGVSVKDSHAPHVRTPHLRVIYSTCSPPPSVCPQSAQWRSDCRAIEGILGFSTRILSPTPEANVGQLSGSDSVKEKQLPDPNTVDYIESDKLTIYGDLFVNKYPLHKRYLPENCQRLHAGRHGLTPDRV